MRTYRTTKKKQDYDNIIHVIESSTDFVKLIKECNETHASIRDLFRLIKSDDKGKEAYICAPSCHVEITPFKIRFCDRRDVVTVNVLIDAAGRPKGWY